MLSGILERRRTPRRALVALARLRSGLRASELGLVGLAIGVGVAAGLCVSLMTSVVNAAHMLIYGIPFDVHLSAAQRVSPLAALAAPMLGGLALGSVDAWRARKKLPHVVDPVEANALRGGRMSLRDSLLVAAQTVTSNGCGASVGLEAGYAQIGAGLASKLGLDMHLRRQDLRMLVGCGAGGAIAAAFGAPLTGAFYAFELIIGAYSLANVGPVFAAALTATLTTKAIIGAPYVISAPEVPALNFVHYGALIGLGLVAAAVGVGAMRAAALIERAFHAAVPWRLPRPVAGGLMLGAMALYTPQVLGAGHGALGLDFYWPMTATQLSVLIVLKLFASLVSLASGFRGGLFFASLFVGSLLGKLYSIGFDVLFPSLGLDTTACVLVGMGALSTAIVGGPLTMTFLVLESTGNLSIAGGALAASIATTLAVRATFGYSFTTWRLHLRGETIRGGQDIGWMRDLTVAKMMIPSPPLFPADQSIRAFREAYPLGSANVVVAVGDEGRYHGLIQVPEAHAMELEEGDDGGPVGLIERLPATTLHPDDDIRSALDLFGVARSDTLAVTARETGRVLGTLGEAFAARRYAQETDGAMKGVLGGG
ncbi:MAG: chloride channel protein [Roseiarcus sp.]|uniref:chloride channel protein n=1 Tax=Roseiarcus sp. TaxID=1969460 RepID=UPI003BB14331